MAPRIVVVKRPRRRRFEIVWAFPLWLRAVASLGTRGPGRSARWPESAGSTPVAQPGLVWLESGVHGCVGCGRCVDVCPARALIVEVEVEIELKVVEEQRSRASSSARASAGVGSDCGPRGRDRDDRFGGRDVKRFDLLPGRCIGCSLCVEVCPESALQPVVGRPRVGAGPRPARLRVIDLLDIERPQAGARIDA